MPEEPGNKKLDEGKDPTPLEPLIGKDVYGGRHQGQNVLERQHGLTQEEVEELNRVFKRSKELLLRLRFDGQDSIRFDKPFPKITIDQNINPEYPDRPFFQIYETIQLPPELDPSLSGRGGGIGTG